MVMVFYNLRLSISMIALCVFIALFLDSGAGYAEENELSAREMVELMVESANAISNGRFVMSKTVWKPGDKSAINKALKKVKEYKKKWSKASPAERARMASVEDFTARVMNRAQKLAVPHTSESIYELTWSKNGAFKFVKTGTITDYRDGQTRDFIEAISSRKDGFFHYFADSRNLYIDKPSQRPQRELLELYGLGLFNEWISPRLFLKYDNANVKFVGEEELNGRKLPIVRIREVREKTIWGKVTMDVKMIIDPEMSFFARRVQLIGNGKIGREVCGSDFEEISPGIWRPRKLEAVLYQSKLFGKPVIKSRTTLEMLEIKINLDLTEDDFKLEIPEGAIVKNYATGKSYLYKSSSKKH